MLFDELSLASDWLSGAGGQWEVATSAKHFPIPLDLTMAQKARSLTTCAQFSFLLRLRLKRNQTIQIRS